MEWQIRLPGEEYLTCDTLEEAEEKATSVIREIPGVIAVIYDSTHRGVCELPDYPRTP
jgi:hypothetical protein